MSGALQVRVFVGPDLVLSEEFDGPVEMGRQTDLSERIHARHDDGGRWRLVIAGMDERSVSRRQVVVRPAGDGTVRVENVSTSQPLRLKGGGELAPGGAADYAPPVAWSFGRRTVEVRPAPNGAGVFLGLPEETIAPGTFTAAGPNRLPCLALPGGEGEGLGVERFVRTLHPVVMALQSANRSTDFFRTAARAVVEALGMSSGCVVLYREGRWRSVAHHGDEARGMGPGGAPGLGARCSLRSRRLLDRLVRERRTLWSDPEPDPGGDPADTTLGGGEPDECCSVVAAPVLDRAGEVIGALYGERHAGHAQGPPPARIRTLDALLLEMLAGGLSTGLSRIELEKAAVTARVRFEQFFTPDLADELAARPDLLTGREVEVTMLFADIRGFSSISERVGPARTLEWVGDVLGVLSDCVLDHRGVLVDYVGDSLIAMWGAPKPVPDHPRLATLAALAMIDRLPAINAKWEPVLGETTDLGIGVNTGPAQVGNTGTSRKFKYGALGNTVNLASRVQGATRYLRARLVVTGSTRARLGDAFSARRLGKAALMHIAEPVELHEVVPPGLPGWDDLRRDYEDALTKFEAREFAGAVRSLGALLAAHPDDGPSLVLMSRAVDPCVSESTGFDPVWRLPGK